MSVAPDRLVAYAVAYARRKGASMSGRLVKLFTNGRSQAVRIPREFELPGDTALIRKEGNRLIIEAMPPQSLIDLLRTLEPIADDFPDFDDPAPEPVNL
jgi:antitoxin VapB